MIKLLLKGKDIYLRNIKVSDVNKVYLSWMNDQKTTQYLESRFQKWTTKKLKEYIKEVNKNPDYVFLAIVLIKNNKHIGNIKIGPINRYHKLGDIGIMIGDKASWGKGYGPQAIKLITRLAFSKLKLNKVTAGIYSNNIGSFKAFSKAGFRKAALLKKHRIYKQNQIVDEILMEKLNED